MSIAVILLVIYSVFLTIMFVMVHCNGNEAGELAKQWKVKFETGDVKLSDCKREKKLLNDRVTELTDAIKKHMYAKGHNRCWLSDLELYQVVNPNPDKMKLALPCLPEFMHNCAVYWRDSQPPEARNLGG